MNATLLRSWLASLAFLALPATGTGQTNPPPGEAALEWIGIDPQSPTRFVQLASGREFRPWGVNYDHDETTGGGRLLEDYWETEWDRVVADFQEIRALGANTVRIHLQVGRFMESADTPRQSSLDRLARLVRLAEETGLYLDLTGLGCYHRSDTPPWYDALDEAGRWAVQARFWEAVAAVCRDSPAIFCYDLMNEPILPGPGRAETDWLAGELGGKHFVQRITLDLAGRTREAVARAWVDTLTAAIRRHDRRHLVTVGVIPWVFVFGGGKPLFYDPAVGENLDFVSVHFYPEAGKVDQALAALKAYQVGKPLVVEETFPLKCSLDELATFIDTASRDGLAQGWISFYWGKTAAEYAAEPDDLAAAVKAAWLERFRQIAPAP
ncbi:MAG: cellulase family glycosylhydrolase [Verrucomicrobiales bacterium]|nr:cellulase family glycosylhydrolase [Verrucomicrobiales bacterium]